MTLIRVRPSAILVRFALVHGEKFSDVEVGKSIILAKDFWTVGGAVDGREDGFGFGAGPVHCIVVHDREVVIRSLLLTVVVQFELNSQLRVFQHRKIYPNMLTPISPLLLMTHPQHMPQLMNNRTQPIRTILPNIHLIPRLLPHILRPPARISNTARLRRHEID